MLAYTANRPLVGKREQSPNALLLIISAHVALLALVMSSKVDIGPLIRPDPRLIDVWVPPPPLPEPAPRPKPQPQPDRLLQPDHPTQIDKTPPPDPKPLVPTNPDAGEVTGDKQLAMGSEVPQPPTAAPIRHAPQLLTPASELKPPYPASKLAAEQEATLQLALTIDDHGRVIAVDPVGRADREFLDAARRYIISHWRYQPATEDGRPISSKLTITLRFQLDG